MFSDLKPYVCTYEDCTAGLFPNSDEWFQHELASHRWCWQCVLCGDMINTFSSETKIRTHFQQQHTGTITGRQLDLILTACQRPMTMFNAESCPFCTDWVSTTDAKKFQQHLAAHLEQISLEVLPLHLIGFEVTETEKSDSTYATEDTVSDEEAIDNLGGHLYRQSNTFEECTEQYRQSFFQQFGTDRSEGRALNVPQADIRLEYSAHVRMSRRYTNLGVEQVERGGYEGEQ